MEAELKIGKPFTIKKDIGLCNTHGIFVISDITKNSVLVSYATEEGLGYSWINKEQFATMFEAKKQDYELTPEETRVMLKYYEEK